ELLAHEVLEGRDRFAQEIRSEPYPASATPKNALGDQSLGSPPHNPLRPPATDAAVPRERSAKLDDAEIQEWMASLDPLRRGDPVITLEGGRDARMRQVGGWGGPERGNALDEVRAPRKLGTDVRSGDGGASAAPAADRSDAGPDDVRRTRSRGLAGE